MLRRLWAAFLAILVLVSIGRAAESLKPGDSIAIIGDSITEQKLYSVFMEDYLLMCQPVADLKTCQFGWGGETSWGFAARMNHDAGWFKPSVATTCFGMNDGGYSPITPDRAKKYHDAQKDVVQKLKAMGARFIVVGSPGCVDADTFRKNPELAVMYNKTLAALRDIARSVADEEGVGFANVYDAMYDTMLKAKEAHGKTYAWAGGDGVHPGPNGHLAMAYAFLKGLGCDGDLGTITIDLAGGKAEGGGGHKVSGVSDGSVDVESSRYPFCFSGDPAGQTSRSAIDFVPFNQDLNRLTLIVKGAKGEQVKITWGKSSKTFSREQMEKGINLAAEFLDNPFSEQFNKVHKLIEAQQNYETPLVKTTIHGMWDAAPNEGEAIAKIIVGFDKKRQSLANSARAAVVPVKHTIKIEAK
ncbi:MAG TPA: SGNH/GDSL hydrolase family protein [Tepidisphaeraceae bacterium]|nr:SGNH/GDSL hydrolase family protein [Tepidisphaeraceae bacterium]